MPTRCPHLYIATLLIAGCDNAFEPLPPVVPQVLFDLSVQAPERTAPGTVPLSGMCDVTVGGLDDSPDRLILKIDGTEVASGPGPEIHGESVVGTIGEHKAEIECVLGEESDVAERTFEVVEPARVTVSLRNFTEDGEPVVHDEGPITFTVGDKEIVSADSAVVDVVPEASYEINADHPGFLSIWARVVNRETGELLAFRSAAGEATSVYVGSYASVDVFKIRESDITSIPNRYLEGLDDASPFYTVDNLRTALLASPFSGGMNRITTEKVTVWTRGKEIEDGSALERAVDQLFVTGGPDHVSTLTDGAIRTSEVSYADEKPDPTEAGCIITIQYATAASHEEHVSIVGAIWQGDVRVLPGSSAGKVMSLLLQVIGLRGTIGSYAIDDYVDGLGRPSEFAKLALKILYASPPNTRF